MSTMYWLTRLDAIIALLGVFTIICVIAVAAGFLLWVCNQDDYMTDDEERFVKVGKKMSKLGLIVGLVLGVALVFIPSTKEAYVIYGVGGTIDYVRSNDKAMKLPDKVVDAFDKWLDTIDEETNELEKVE